MKYYLKIISGMRLQKLFDVINQIHTKTGKNRFFMFFDIIWCGLTIGAGYNDYNIFGYYNMNHAQRKTFVNRVKNKKIIKMCNDPKFDYIFDNKSEFNKVFTKYLNRTYLAVKDMKLEDFKKFMKGKKVIFAKPDVGESGKGIEKLETKDYKNLTEMYDYIMSKNFGVIEELILQHETLNKLYPLSINSLRIVSLVVDGEAHIVYVTSKMGNDGKYVDNLESLGLCCPVDLKTSKIMGIGHTSRLETFEKHPYTGVKFIGYKLPYIKEACELVKQAALEIEGIRYVGWDVFIGVDGPGIIEGNNYPGYDFWQLPEHTPEKEGLWPYYLEKLPGVDKIKL